MARYRVEWRQFRGEDAIPVFLQRLEHAVDAVGVARIAASIGDAAWHREFRVVRGAQDAFTDLHRIEDWVRAGGELPKATPRHMWRDDLAHDLAADFFLQTMDQGTMGAVSAGALSYADADAIVRFARAAVLRPRL